MRHGWIIVLASAVLVSCRSLGPLPTAASRGPAGSAAPAEPPASMAGRVASAMSPAFLIEAPDATAETQVVLPLSAVRVGVGPRPVFTAWDILNAEVAPLELGTGVSFQLVPTAARELAELSVTARGRRLVFVADGRPLGAVRLGEATAGGRLVMFMEIPDTELPRLVAALQRCR